ncbi:MAG TPA: FAD-binding oxidoreductase [Gaiellales bacterium]|jgi:FAD/FMN-containing dehydrogenase|nr:FAD-binding oxidoreductase [Gaiellales bacterium]
MAISPRAAAPLDPSELRARVTGDVVLPGDPEWDAARLAWNLAVDQRPAMVALPETSDDVAAVVAYAAQAGLRVAVQGTGHGAVARGGELSDSILLKMERMRGVQIDAAGRTARVEAGVIWSEVAEAAAEHGLATLAGSSPDVGVVGYTLGGGLSWLGRRHGLAASSVVSVEIVTADGELRRIDAETDADLFWAVRGGGGSFGAVTAIEFALFPLAEVYAGVMLWPIERASEILHAWREWAADMPDDMTTVGRLLQLPPIPDIPEPLRGRSFVAVEAFYLGDEAEGTALVAPIRALGAEIDTVATIPVAALQHVHMDPEHPVPGLGDGMLLDDLSATSIDALVAAAGPGSGSPFLSVEVRQLGGAIARPAAGGGAVSHLDADFALYAVGIAMSPEQAAAISAHVSLLHEALAPWASETTYLNFAEADIAGDRLFGPYAHHRLRAVKAAYDPADLFRSNHPVVPA